MHLHYLTLERQVAFLREKISGERISDCFTQTKNEWILRFADGESALQLSCDSRFPYILWSDKVHRSKNSTDVMNAICGQQIAGIEMAAGDRVIRLRFVNNENTLALKFFTAQSNFFLLDSAGKILDSFKNARKHAGETFTIGDSPLADPLSIERDDFLHLLDTHRDALFVQFLRRFRHLSRPVIRELLYRSAVPETLTLAEGTTEQLLALWVNMQNLLQECRTDTPRIYYEDELPAQFTLTEFRHLAHLPVKMFDTINEALRFFAFRRQRIADRQQSRKQMQAVISRKMQSLQHHIEQLSQPVDTSKQTYYQQIGELLKAQPQLIRPGAESVTLVNYFDETLPEIRVPVDPELSPQENAERYFRKSRQYQRNLREREARTAELQSQLAELSSINALLEKTTDSKALRQIEERLKSMHILQSQQEETEQYRLPYKTYFFKDTEIWVGKSAADNDIMTFKRASKEDFWLHVQGYAGSHVILRNPQRAEQPPQHALNYAAQLAATNSQAKHASYVPVMFTKVKYLRKPRKSPAGAVIPSRVKTIYVDPL